MGNVLYLLDIDEERDFVKEEADVIVMQISEDIILDNILEQISNSLDYKFYDRNKQSFFEYFEKRFEFVIKRYDDDTDVVHRCKMAYNDVLNQIMEKIEEMFEFNIEFEENILIEKKAEYIKSLYYFFVINQKENIENLLINIIHKNIDFLKNNFKDNISKDVEKSLSYNNLRKSIDNDYTPLIYYTNEVLDNIEVEFNEEILELMIKGEEDELNNFYVDRLLIEQSIGSVVFENNLLDTLSPLIEENKILKRSIQSRLIRIYR